MMEAEFACLQFICIDVSRCFAWPRIRAANSDGEAEAFCLESHPRCEAKTWHRTKWPEVNQSKLMLMHARILRHWSWSKTSKIAARVFALPVLNMSNPNALKLTKLRCWGRWKRRRPSAKRYTNSSPPLLARMGQVDFLWNYDDLNDLCWKSFNLQRAQADASGDGRLSYEELEAALQASAMQSSAVTEVTNIMTLNAMKARRQEPGVEAWLKALELEIHDAWLSFKTPGRQGICQVRLSAQSG